MPAPSARTLVRLIVDKNPLFLLSALLLLGGAWLTNQPGPDGGRDLGMLLRLFATVQGYEVALLAAAWALARRAGLERDVRGLGLLLVPFLMDVSCTNAVVAEHTPTWAADALLVSLVVGLAAVKARVAARLARVRFDRPAWAALLVGPALVGAAPVAASWLRHHGVDAGGVGLGLGFSVAGFLAAVAGASREGLAERRSGDVSHTGRSPSTSRTREASVAETGAERFDGLAERRSGDVSHTGRSPSASRTREASVAETGAERFDGPVRAVGATAVVVATFHALATGYGQSGDALHVIGPILLALGPALPRLLGRAAPALVTTWSPLVLPIAGAIACGLPGLEAPEASILGVTSWRAGLIVAGGIHAAVLARRGGLAPLLGVALAVHLALSGDGMRASVGSLGQPGLGAPVVLAALFVLGIVRRAHPLLLAPLLAGGALGVLRVGPTSAASLDLALALATLGAGLLAWTHRAHGADIAGARWRVLGAGLAWLPLQVAALGGDPLAATFAQAGVVALLGLGALTRTRSHAVPAVVLLLEAARAVTPTTSAGWGGVGLALAFGAVALGVAVSLQRERLLAWLDAPAQDADAPPAARRDWAVGLRGAAPVGLALLVAGFAVALGGARGGKLAYAADSITSGSMRTIAAAQSVYAQGDKDGDGDADFASLRELGRLGLIDRALAGGQTRGHVLRVVAWQETRATATGQVVLQRWAAIAAPTAPGGRWMRIVDGGPLEKEYAPLSLPEIPDEVALAAGE